MLAYETAVAFISIPFIYFLTKKASSFDLNLKTAFYVSFILCIDAMLLPLAFRFSVLWVWIVISALIMISMPLRRVFFLREKQSKPNPEKFQEFLAHNSNVGEQRQIEAQPSKNDLVFKPRAFSNNKAKELNMPEESDRQYELEEKEKTVKIEDQENLKLDSNEIDSGKYEENIPKMPGLKGLDFTVLKGNQNEKVLESEEGIKELDNSTVAMDTADSDYRLTESSEKQDIIEEITINDLIECGFSAKTAGRFQSAAEWFARALALQPDSDLALYLVIDIYWLLTSSGKKDDAMVQLNNFWHEYKNLLTPENEKKFTEWLNKENISKEQLNI